MPEDYFASRQWSLSFQLQCRGRNIYDDANNPGSLTQIAMSVSWRVSPSGADENSDERSDSLNGNCGCACFDIRIQLRKKVGDAMDVNLVGKNMVRNSTSQGPLQRDK